MEVTNELDREPAVGLLERDARLHIAHPEIFRLLVAPGKPHPQQTTAQQMQLDEARRLYVSGENSILYAECLINESHLRTEA
jgi:hypothetical protein